MNYRTWHTGIAKATKLSQAYETCSEIGNTTGHQSSLLNSEKKSNFLYPI